MITYTRGNLLEAEAEALVNTVNTKGVMGKGIALAFKQAYPDMFAAYAEACQRGEVQTGRMFVVQREQPPRWIINFPTKQNYRKPSRIEWIDEGLVDLKRVIVDRGIPSIAIPALGCGLGGLDWSDVRPRIETVLGSLTDVEIVVYEPM